MPNPHSKASDGASSNNLNDDPHVLVGVVTRNRASILPQALRSALAQDYPGAKIVVLDDGSNDETHKLSPQFATVDWHRASVSVGLMEARNRLMLLPARYYVSLDDDAWFIKGDEISIAIRYLDHNRQVGALAFDVLGPERSHEVSRTIPHATDMFAGCGHVLRLSSAREAGLYFRSPEPYGTEERDLCLRLLDKEIETHILPGVHVWHERTGISRDLSAQHSSGVCNDLTFVILRCPLALLLIVLPIKVVNHLRFGIQKSFFLKPCFAGLGLFLLHLRGSWKQRKPVRVATFIKFLRLSRRK